MNIKNSISTERIAYDEATGLYKILLSSILAILLRSFSLRSLLLPFFTAMYASVLRCKKRTCHY